MVFQLIYVSAAGPDTNASVLQSIALKAAKNNAKSEITGLMVFFEGSIMQILEGEQLYILDLVARIAQDDRHTNMMILHERNIPERQFSNWRMGFKPVADIEAYQELFGIDPASFQRALPDNPDKVLRALARSFERTSGLATAN